MRAYKGKVDESVGGAPQVLDVPPFSSLVRVQAIYYGSESPSNTLKLFDKDMDEVFYITGSPNLRTIPLDGQITLAFPLYYQDTDLDGGNKIIIFGEIVE